MVKRLFVICMALTGCAAGDGPWSALLPAASPTSGFTAYRMFALAKDGSSLICEIDAGQPVRSVAESTKSFLEAAIPEMGNEKDGITLAFSSRTKGNVSPNIYGGFQLNTGEVNVGEGGMGPLNINVAKKQYKAALKAVTQCRALSINPTAQSDYVITRYQPLDSEMRAAAIGAVVRLTEYAKRIMHQIDSVQGGKIAPGWT